VKRHLADYLEGDLDLEARAIFDAHLDQCEPCAREVAEMQQTIRLLRLLPEPEPPPMIAADVMRRIRAGEAEPSFLGRIGQWLGAVLEPNFVLPASAIAAAALVLVVLQQPGPSENAFRSQPGREGVDRPGGAEGRAALRVTSPADRATVFSDGLLAPSGRREGDFVIPELFASGGAGLAGAMPPQTGVLRQHNAGRAPRVRTISQPQRVEIGAAPPVPYRIGSESSEDARDAWIARALEDPSGFARYLANQTLAEQELWVARLGERAESRGLLDELLQALRTSGDETATWLASDFEAQAGRTQRAAAESAGTPSR
jgi:hypothetical protein